MNGSGYLVEIVPESEEHMLYLACRTDLTTQLLIKMSRRYDPQCMKGKAKLMAALEAKKPIEGPINRIALIKGLPVGIAGIIICTTSRGVKSGLLTKVAFVRNLRPMNFIFRMLTCELTDLAREQQVRDVTLMFTPTQRQARTYRSLGFVGSSPRRLTWLS